VPRGQTSNLPKERRGGREVVDYREGAAIAERENFSSDAMQTPLLQSCKPAASSITAILSTCFHVQIDAKYYRDWAIRSFLGSCDAVRRKKDVSLRSRCNKDEGYFSFPFPQAGSSPTKICFNNGTNRSCTDVLCL
jgi:hypothetical protein